MKKNYIQYLRSGPGPSQAQVLVNPLSESPISEQRSKILSYTIASNKTSQLMLYLEIESQKDQDIVVLALLSL